MQANGWGPGVALGRGLGVLDGALLYSRPPVYYYLCTVILTG